MSKLLILIVLVLLPQHMATFSIVDINSEAPRQSHLGNSAFNFGVPHLTGEDFRVLLQDKAEDDLAVLLGGQQLTLLNSNQVTVERGKIITAGSDMCKSSCDSYTEEQKKGQYPYLDSSVIIGYKSDLLRILPQDLPELQSYLSEKFLAGSNDILVDVTGEKILTIGEKNFKLVEIEFKDTNNTLLLEGNRPGIVLIDESAPLPAQRLFSEIGRYVGNGVTRTTCNTCNMKQDISPTLFIAVYIEEHYPFLSNLLRTLQNMKYDKSKVELVILSLEDGEQIEEWKPEGFQKFTHLVEEFDSEDQDSKHYFLDMFSESGAEYYVYIDSSVHITSTTIPELVSYQKPVISPMLVKRDGTAWSNFWGTFTDSWDYKRSTDYDNIITRTVKGVMPVACVRNMYVIERSVALRMLEWNVYDHHLEPDISFCKTLFEKRVPVFLSNVHNYGWLKSHGNTTDLKLTGIHSEDWREKYLESKVLKAEAFSEPCKNLYRHKSVFSEEFGREMVKTLGHFKGYTQRPYHYDRPGYNFSRSEYNETLTSVIMDLTVDIIPKMYNGYKPKRELYDSWIIEVEGAYEQKRHPHRGNPAAYHVLVPLNDFSTSEGGKTGYYFTKQNCTVTDVKSGDLLIFPGFITHQKREDEPVQGIHLYLELSFDPPS